MASSAVAGLGLAGGLCLGRRRRAHRGLTPPAAPVLDRWSSSPAPIPGAGAQRLRAAAEEGPEAGARAPQGSGAGTAGRGPARYRVMDDVLGKASLPGRKHDEKLRVFLLEIVN